MNELRKIYHLSQNDNCMYMNQWCPIAKIAMTMWQNNLKSDVQSFLDRFAIPIAIQYYTGNKLPKDAHTMKFLFLIMSHESKFWTRHLGRDKLREYGEYVIDVMQRAQEDPGKSIYITHEPTRKTNNNIIQDIDAPTNFYIFVGNRN